MAIMPRDWLQPTGPDDEGDEPPVHMRWLWFIGISIASALVVITLAYILRGFLFL